MSRWGLQIVMAATLAVSTFGLSVTRSTEAIAGCDEDNPISPARNAQIVLSGADSVDETHAELRTFVATGSLGRVDASVVSASPPGVVLRLTAVPHLSRFSANYGEELKGVNIIAALKAGKRPARVVVRVQQVCAQYFRDSFLYQ
jgi:hypothetical protein